MPVSRDEKTDEEPVKAKASVGERNHKHERFVRRHTPGQVPAVDPNPPDWTKASDHERHRHGLPGKQWVENN